MVGSDISKHKSIVVSRRPGGQVEVLPFDVDHDVAGIKNLVLDTCSQICKLLVVFGIIASLCN